MRGMSAEVEKQSEVLAHTPCRDNSKCSVLSPFWRGVLNRCIRDCVRYFVIVEISKLVVLSTSPGKMEWKEGRTIRSRD